MDRRTEFMENVDKNVKRELQFKRARTTELHKLLEIAYEDRMKGRLQKIYKMKENN